MRLFGILRSASKFPKEYSNFPERYIERAKEQIEFKTPKGRQYQNRMLKREVFTYGIHRPWTQEFYEENRPGKYVKEDVVEPLIRWNIFRGDLVEILVGKDKGKQGIVNYIIKERNWVCVEGLNCKYEYVTGFGKVKTMVKDEQPLLINREVALVDPADSKPTKVEWRFTEEGEEVRVSLRTGRIIPIPRRAEETYDYKERKYYEEQPKDTVAKDIKQVTFQPRLLTFEQEIMENMGITESRLPCKIYWY